MEKEKYYVIKVGALYLECYSIDKEYVDYDFISYISFAPVEKEAMKFKKIDKAFALSKILESYLNVTSYVLEYQGDDNEK